MPMRGPMRGPTQGSTRAPRGDRDDGRPLYARVRERLLARIRSGEWKPGQLIPNEFAIAAEFGVSQGTARKAVSELAAEQLVRRRQGRGTFVVEHTPTDMLFRFFNMFDAAGAPLIPDSRSIRCWVAPRPTAAERAALALDTRSPVIRITRTRTTRGKPFIAETIALPQRLFPGLAERAEIPNTLYDLFQRAFGILVVRTDDRISAVSARAAPAAALGIAIATPLLRIDRIAFTLDDTPIEWRVSLCHLEAAHYLSRSR
jgi:GntR family transcriptional regulator